MDVFVDTLGAPSFSIEVGFWDTVLTIKQKIEKSQGVPVSKQILFFKAKVLQDHFDVRQCQIVQNSRLKLFFSPDDNPNQNNDQVPQTEQPSSSSASSNPIEEFANATQSWPLTVGRNNDQVLLRREETQVSSLNEFRGIQESPVMTVEGKNEYKMLHQTEQSLVASDRSVGDTSVMVRSNVYNESQSLREIEKLLDLEDNLAPVTVGSSSNANQEVGTLASDKGKEIIDIPDSPVKKEIKTNPMKMIVKVMPFKETWSIPVEVNEDDNVEELRKELVKMKERGQINLPQEEEGFFFMLNQGSLIENQSFRWNNVADGDTIEIYHGFIT